MEENKEGKFILIALALIVACALTYYLFYFTYSQAGQCLKEPVVFYTKQAYKEYNSNLVCNCVYDNPQYAPLIFTKEGIEVNDKIFIGNNETYPIINLSLNTP